MSKNFTSGLDTILGENPSKPQKNTSIKTTRMITKTSQLGTKEHETRATFIIAEEHLEAIKALAYWERMSIKELTALIIQTYLETKGKTLQTAIAAYKKKLHTSLQKK